MAVAPQLVISGPYRQEMVRDSSSGRDAITKPDDDAVAVLFYLIAVAVTVISTKYHWQKEVMNNPATSFVHLLWGSRSGDFDRYGHLIDVNFLMLVCVCGEKDRGWQSAGLKPARTRKTQRKWDTLLCLVVGVGETGGSGGQSRAEDGLCDDIDWGGTRASRLTLQLSAELCKSDASETLVKTLVTLANARGR
eukprot:scaffold44423_cov48-Cyclotella_meneghiniana.AAC.4